MIKLTISKSEKCMKKSSTVLGNDQAISGDGGGAARGWSGEDDKSLVRLVQVRWSLVTASPSPQR